MRWIGLGLLLSLVGLSAALAHRLIHTIPYQRLQRAQEHRQPVEEAERAVFARLEEDARKANLPEVPAFPFSSRRPELVAAVYRFAALHPEVLRFVPCFCGCERHGHTANLDCFVGRERSTHWEWEAHGAG